MKIARVIRVTAAVLLVTGLGGCATGGEPEFGSSVRHMIVGQSYDPAAPADTLPTTDGEKAGMAVKAYRADKKAGGSTRQSSNALLMPVIQ